MILAVSASAFPETRQKAADAGFDGFVSKPVRMEELLELLAAKLPPSGWSRTRDQRIQAFCPPRSPW